MNNLMSVLMNAKRKHVFRTENDFIKLLDALRLFDNQLNLDWDDGAGEEWARLTHKDHGIVYMINSRIGIIFARTSYQNLIPSEIYLKYEICITDNYDDDAWYVDLSELKSEIKQIVWHASEDAVNPNSFSLNDLYFATI